MASLINKIKEEINAGITVIATDKASPLSTDWHEAKDAKIEGEDLLLQRKDTGEWFRPRGTIYINPGGTGQSHTE
jgi:hypothetical protein